MQLFHGSQVLQKPSGVLTHFGSMLVAAQRLESVFATQNSAVYDGEDTVTLLDFQGLPIETKTIVELGRDFVEYAKKTKISKFSLDVRNPLRLNDLWGDDPIASGGLGVISTENNLSKKQR